MSSLPAKNILNKYSRILTQQKEHGAAQAMLHGVGLTIQDFNKPQAGIVSNWFEGNTCNMHLNELSDIIKTSCKGSGFVPFRFNTIGVSDGMSNGTSGMKYSLQSREIIADSIETVVQAQFYDSLVCVPGCDKNMPGCVMAMIRLNRPSIMVYGGTIRAGVGKGCTKLDIVSAFQAYGEYLKGKITDIERLDIIKNACPGAGACGGMYTANTMACAIEALGLSLPYSSSFPAMSSNKKDECMNIGKHLMNLIKNDIKPKDILTKKSFENAITLIMALGGSTNAVLHLIAIAKTANIDITLKDFQYFSDKTPFLADLKPSGKYVMEDIHKAGGTPAVIKYLYEEGYIHGDCLTVTGKNIKENIAHIKPLENDQDIIRNVKTPLKDSGHIQILYGNLAPNGSVAKITGKEGLKFSGNARVYDSEFEMLNGLKNNEINKKDVIVIRYEGPKGGPGMPEMLTPTSAIMGAGLGKDVAMLTDGRFSGGSHGFIIGHITPEAQEGGPIALIKTGDKIDIDSVKRQINVLISEEEMELRRKQWSPPPYKNRSGTLWKYIKNVSSASEGCVTDS